MALVLMLALFVTGCGKDFDASGYTQALLDLTFQGDTSRARTYMEDATENSLMRQYQQSIDNFVAANITSEIEMNETKTAQFADLVSKIFATMRYDVGKAEKTGKREYEVPVSIQPSDVFVNFQQSLSQDSIKITQKIKEGGYEGTTEEVTQQVLNDISTMLTNCWTPPIRTLHMERKKRSSCMCRQIRIMNIPLMRMI